MDHNGFSLVEMLIYVAILCIVGVTLIGSAMGLMRSYTHLAASQDVTTSAEIVLERLMREGRDAYRIDLAGSVFATTSSTLVLNTVDDAGAPTTVTFYRSSDRIYFRKGSAASEPMTRTGVTVTNFLIRRFAGGTHADAVSIEMDLLGPQGVTTTPSHFQTSFVLRGVAP